MRQMAAYFRFADSVLFAAGRQSIEKRSFRMQEIPASFLYTKPGKPGREVFVMSQIKVSHVTFSYEGSFDEIFTDVSFVLDTDWKLGFIGRNGKGKTTFLRLLLGELPYQGTILSSEEFEYFPFPVEDPGKNTLELLYQWNPWLEYWELVREMNLLEVKEEVLERAFSTLSNGEQTKVMLAALFLKPHGFLLIDEPTNHLDYHAREIISRYLSRKKGFLLVSHDRSFLDGCVDHVLVLNRSSIGVFQGNFSSWWENKERQDSEELSRQAKLKREIGRLREAARQTENWANDVEKSKKGKGACGLKPDRGYVGHKAAKMMKRSKVTERRMNLAVEEKGKLLKDLEETESLKLFPEQYHKEVLLRMKEAVFSYGGKRVEMEPVSFTLTQGSRLALLGKNGSGKSTVIRAILKAAGMDWKALPGRDGKEELVVEKGEVEAGSGLKISYVPQDTSFLKGNLRDFAEREGVDLTVLMTLLSKLDFSREQMLKDMAEFSAGQKKKVYLAKSLAMKAHLYLWDEPLNYVDIFSRMQLERLIREHPFTFVFVEHDRAFVEEIATEVVEL